MEAAEQDQVGEIGPPAAGPVLDVVCVQVSSVVATDEPTSPTVALLERPAESRADQSFRAALIHGSAVRAVDHDAENGIASDAVQRLRMDARAVAEVASAAAQRTSSLGSRAPGVAAGWRSPIRLVAGLAGLVDPELVKISMDDDLEPVGAAAVDGSVRQRRGGHGDEGVGGGAPVGVGFLVVPVRRDRAFVAVSCLAVGSVAAPVLAPSRAGIGVLSRGVARVRGAWRRARPGRARPPRPSAWPESPATRRRPSGRSRTWPVDPTAGVRAGWRAGSRRPRARRASLSCSARC